ncbi:hypothetical protein DPMN_032071 [Dreissena polymorpha]|uniref:Uncharacterized protein n=1 Tax=Dreissena polymorpha TaxID=45954 RepID=A0A9D4M324_DREPO|nr:hypothetical protein DPMN_032071 [Dreissena polymorpha]
MVMMIFFYHDDEDGEVRVEFICNSKYTDTRVLSHYRRVTSGERRQPDADQTDHGDPRPKSLRASLCYQAGQPDPYLKGPNVSIPGADVLRLVSGAVPA